MIDFKKRQFERALDEIMKLIRQLKEHVVNLHEEVKILRQSTISEIKKIHVGEGAAGLMKSEELRLKDKTKRTKYTIHNSR